MNKLYTNMLFHSALDFSIRNFSQSMCNPKIELLTSVHCIFLKHEFNVESDYNNNMSLIKPDATV